MYSNAFRRQYITNGISFLPNEPDLNEPPFGARVMASPCPVPRDGDLNGDGATNGLDIPSFMHAIVTGSTNTTHVCAADFSGNGVVDPGDIPGLVAQMLAP